VPSIQAFFRDCLHNHIKGTELSDQELFHVFEHVLSMNRGLLLREFSSSISSHHQDKILDILSLSRTGKPLAYCLGEMDFMGQRYYVTEDVLIPRPETEVLVERAITFLNGSQTITSCVECGVGSGVISLEIARRFPDIPFQCWDISPGAIECSKKNVARHRLSNCEIQRGDFFQASLELDSSTLLLSNPPYIPVRDLQFLDASVKEFEPLIALDGGIDGLDFYRRLIPFVENEGCSLIVEVGIHQSEQLIELYPHLQIEVTKDLKGIDRVLFIQQ